MNNRSSNTFVVAGGRDSSPRTMSKESSSSTAMYGGDATTMAGRTNFGKSFDAKLDLQNPSSIFRENLRLRVREDEKLLGNMIRQQREGGGRDYYFSGDESKTNDEYRTANVYAGPAVTATPNIVNGNNSLYGKLLDIEQGFSNQTMTIRALEGNLVNRDDEIKTLRSELVKKLERIVELEFELKASVPQYDEDLLTLTGDQLYDIDLDGSIRGDNSNSVEMQRAKLMVTKLMADLRNLENRYKEDQLKSARAIEELRLQNGELRENKTSMIAGLEKRVREIEKECVQLERSVQVKDMQIGNLKKELAALRIDQLSGRRSSGSNDGQYSDFDRALLRSTPSASEREYARSSSFRRGRDDTPRSMGGDEINDRDVMRSSNFDRNRSASRSRAPSPGRNIRFAEDAKEEEALALAKESQQELIRRSLQRAGSFSSLGQLNDRDSARLTEYEAFVRNEEQRERGGSFREEGRNSIGGSSVSGARRSDDLRAVKQDQEQAIQRAKTNGLFRQASRRLFGRAY